MGATRLKAWPKPVRPVTSKSVKAPIADKAVKPAEDK